MPSCDLAFNSIPIPIPSALKIPGITISVPISELELHITDHDISNLPSRTKGSQNSFLIKMWEYTIHVHSCSKQRILLWYDNVLCHQPRGSSEGEVPAAIGNSLQPTRPGQGFSIKGFLTHFFVFALRKAVVMNT